MAIYHHFADKQALLDTIVADVITELDDVMRSAAADAPDPLAALCAELAAYVHFAIERPVYYRYATMEQRRTRAGENQLDNILADVVQRRLGAAVSAGMESAYITRGDPRTVTLAIWSAAHGLAALMIARPELGWGDRPAFIDDALRVVVSGHAAEIPRRDR
jgi:AcrR family transcriptional regulator